MSRGSYCPSSSGVRANHAGSPDARILRNRNMIVHKKDSGNDVRRLKTYPVLSAVASLLADGPLPSASIAILAAYCLHALHGSLKVLCLSHPDRNIHG